jgi:Tfp pilus assembly protein PilV
MKVSIGSQKGARRLAGAALVDTLLATVILGVSAAGLMGSFASGFVMVRMTRENQRATQILLEKVETLRLYNWDQINTPGFIPTSFTNTFDPQAATNSQGTVYLGTCTITNSPFSSSYSNNVRLVTVGLSWTTGSLPRQRTLTTLISRDGLQNYVY